MPGANMLSGMHVVLLAMLYVVGRMTWQWYVSIGQVHGVLLSFVHVFRTGSLGLRPMTGRVRGKKNIAW